MNESSRRSLHTPMPTRGFATRDLWKKKSTKAGFWKMVGRAGAVSVMLDGGKTNNATWGLSP